MNRHLFGALAALLFAALACGSGSTSGGDSGAGSSSRDISGEYTVTGVDLDGEPYEGEATITRISGNQYAINWLFGGQTETGAGSLDGNTLSATWSDGEYSGKISYTVQPDGTLAGTWTEDGSVGQGTETLTPK